MMNFLFVLILSIGYTFAGPRDEAQDILKRFHTETSVQKRLNLISKIFIGLPYGKNGPLGEGPEARFDQDPLYRFDTFDCTTYVETIMALAVARDINEFEMHLDNIRYKDGEIDYFKRNHFTDLQWIPFNVENGYMSETTHEAAAPHEIKIAEAMINYPGWIMSHTLPQIIVPMATSLEKEARLQELKSFAPDFAAQTARVPYIEISKILAKPSMLQKIPSGTIVNFVRPNWDLTQVNGTHQNISHQGFLFRQKNVLYLRHATISSMKVEELPFLDYLKRFQNHPTLKGIHLMKMN